MIGSETFIMVAFRCRDSSTSCCLASAICASKNSRRAFLLITLASITSPAFSAVFSLSNRDLTVVADKLDADGAGLGHGG